MSRWIELLEGGEHNRLSMARMLQLLAYPPATAVMIWIHTTEAMSLYLSAFVLNGAVSKGLDVMAKNKAGKNAASNNKRL